jgi:type II secretory pathway pseudopilin PulG
MKQLKSHHPLALIDARPGPHRGFTLLEVVAALALTTMVLGAVFALLARGLKTPRLETERADVQAQTRSALDAISRDVLEAGADLPPEFPAFTPPQINPELLASEGDAIELVGNLDEQRAVEPVRVRSFDGRVAQLESDAAAHIRRGDLVLVYDDAPTDGTWMFGLVAEVRAGDPPELVLKTRPGESEGEVTLPWFIDNYNRPSPAAGFVTPVSVIHYSLARDAGSTVQGTPERVLMRRVNWGPPQPVAYAENMEIRYVIGSTVADVDPPGQPDTRRGEPQFRIQSANAESPRRGDGPPPQDQRYRDRGPRNGEEGVRIPPLPQVDPRSPLQPDKVVRGVRITLTGRSHSGNLEGSQRLAAGSDPNGFLRVTYTSRVAARNLLFRLSARGQNQAFN